MKIIKAEEAKKIYQSKRNKTYQKAFKKGIALLNEAIKEGKKMTDMYGYEDAIKALHDLFKANGYEVRMEPKSDGDFTLYVSWV